jgi:DNA-binding beta-propeller fold protein YncE
VVIPAGGGAQTTLPVSGLVVPFGVTVDPNGNIYVSDAKTIQVTELPAGGGAQTTVSVSGLILPSSVAADKSGNVYIADYGNSQVIEIPAAPAPSGP